MIVPLNLIHPSDAYDMSFTIVAHNTAKDYYDSLVLAEQVGPTPNEIEYRQRLETLRNMVLFRGYYGQFEQPLELRIGMYAAVEQLRTAVIQ